MSVEITCGKCGEKITNMKMLKSIKDVMNPYGGKCPSCGQKLSTSEFSLDVQEKWSKISSNQRSFLIFKKIDPEFCNYDQQILN